MLRGGLRDPTRQGTLAHPDSTYEWRRKGEHVNGTLIYDHYYRINAAITYIGLDSVVMAVPASLRAPQYQDGRWDADPSQALRLKYFDPPPGQKAKPMALVSLGSDSRYGHAIEIIRNLKARRVCHVAIREASTPTPSMIDFGNGAEKSLEIPTIVLCGQAYGDGSGFDGRLPADHLLHIGAGSER